MESSDTMGCEQHFRRSRSGHFMERDGAARKPGVAFCKDKKVCFFARDQALLASVLYALSRRPDSYYVKYSVEPRDGVYLGRCFMVDRELVGQVWAEFKMHPRLHCCVQDDAFTSDYRDQVRYWRERE